MMMMMMRVSFLAHSTGAEEMKEPSSPMNRGNESRRSTLQPPPSHYLLSP